MGTSNVTSKVNDWYSFSILYLCNATRFNDTKVKNMVALFHWPLAKWENVRTHNTFQIILLCISKFHRYKQQQYSKIIIFTDIFHIWPLSSLRQVVLNADNLFSQRVAV